jgi:hypothetical protein
MTGLELASEGERLALVQYLERLLALDGRAAVRLQAAGTTLGVWSGPPFEVVALRPTRLARPLEADVTASAQRLVDRLGERQVELPAAVNGPSWVGLLPPRHGWEERMRGDVANVRAAVESATQFFRERSAGVEDRGRLEAIANDVWERTCLAEVPVRCAHAAEALGLMGPGDGVAVAWATDTWVRLAVPGGSVATRRGLLPSLPFIPI